jgi:hypothetical protein
MRTDNVPLNVKAIFREKKVSHTMFDVARLRNLCREFAGFVLDCQKVKPELKKGQTRLQAFE